MVLGSRTNRPRFSPSLARAPIEVVKWELAASQSRFIRLAGTRPPLGIMHRSRHDRRQKRLRRHHCAQRFRRLMGEALEKRMVLSLNPFFLADANVVPAGVTVNGPIVSTGTVAFFS